VTAYDYTRQVWTEGAEAVAVRISQVTADVATLKGPEGPTFAKWLNLDRQRTLRDRVRELKNLTSAPAADIASAGPNHVTYYHE